MITAVNNRSYSLRDQAVRRITATELALSSLRMSANTHRDSNDAAAIAAYYKQAIELMEDQLKNDQKLLNSLQEA